MAIKTTASKKRMIKMIEDTAGGRRCRCTETAAGGAYTVGSFHPRLCLQACKQVVQCARPAWSRILLIPTQRM